VVSDPPAWQPTAHEYQLICSMIIGDLARDEPRMSRQRWDELQALLDRCRRAEYNSLKAAAPPVLASSTIPKGHNMTDGEVP
jgi:hypothetical protein